MKTNTILTSVKNAKTLEALTCLNYYATKTLGNEELKASALTSLSRTNSVLKLLGLYSDLTIITAIDYYNTLSPEDLDEFNKAYDYNFTLHTYFISDMLKKIEKDELTILNILTA